MAPFSEKHENITLQTHRAAQYPTWVTLGLKYKALILPALIAAWEKVTAMNKSPREIFPECHYS